MTLSALSRVYDIESRLYYSNDKDDGGRMPKNATSVDAEASSSRGELSLPGTEFVYCTIKTLNLYPLGVVTLHHSSVCEEGGSAL